LSNSLPDAEEQQLHYMDVILKCLIKSGKS